MRYLYYCNSSYQILNALNLNWHRKNNNFENIEDYCADLIILNAFDGAEDIVNRIKEKKLFENVFLVNRVHNTGLFHRIKGIINYTNPSVFLKKCGISNPLTFKDKYDVITSPKYSKVPAAIWQLNKNASLNLFEDGLASYSDEIVIFPKTKIKRFLYKISNYNREFNEFERLYLNQTSLYKGKYSARIKQIPSVDKTIAKELKTIFKTVTINDKKKYIWLGQYTKDNINDITNEILIKFKDISIYKPHPRFQLDIKELDSFVSSNAWEIDVLGIDNIDSKCLIAIYSTSLFTPKILYNMEPYVILTYRLTSNSDYKTMDSFTKNFIQLYKDKEKIMIPETIEEYEEDIKKISTKSM